MAVDAALHGGCYTYQGVPGLVPVHWCAELCPGVSGAELYGSRAGIGSLWVGPVPGTYDVEEVCGVPNLC